MAFNLSFLRKSNPQSIKDLNSTTLKKEVETLKQEEQKLNEEALSIEKTRNEALAAFHTAREKGEDYQAKLLARSLKNIDDQRTGLDFRHNALAKQQRMTSGLILLKENDEFVNRISGSSHLKNMNLAELQGWVEQATENSELSLSNLEDMIGTMNNSFATNSQQDDADMDDYMAALDKETPNNQYASAKTQQSDNEIAASIEQVDKLYEGLEKATEQKA